MDTRHQLIFTMPPAQCSYHRRLSLENPPGYFKKRKREMKTAPDELRKTPIIQLSKHYLSIHCVYLFIGLVIVTNFVNMSAASTLENDLKVLSLTTTSTEPTTTTSNYNNTSQHICQPIEVRVLDDLNKIRGCRIIEGSLNILNLDSNTLDEYDGFSFPELYEITEYMLVYRWTALKSFEKVFPNLAVIRGNVLFHNYALIIYELDDLEDIGLVNLQAINRGGVRIERNANLCYAKSINWNVIVVSKDIKFRDNKHELLCSLCPAKDNQTQTCQKSSREDREGFHCWNKNNCQRICNTKCPSGIACSKSGKCCNPECLGGCADDDPSKCWACKNLDVGVREAVCAEKCKTGYYKYFDRRCISVEECYKMNDRAFKEGEFPYIPVNLTCKKDDPAKCEGAVCMRGCPPGYEDQKGEDGRSKCKECGDKCVRQCESAKVIDSIAAANGLKGCTHILGSIEISIKNANTGEGGPNIIQELEESLADIEEIRDYLKIVRSYPIVSLNFFKKLRVIHGNATESGNAVMIWDNPNLQFLLKDNRNITIKNGNAFFFMNPQLCFKNIITMVPDKSRFDDLKAVERSNGDKVPCNVTNIKVLVQPSSSNSALLSWNSLPIEDDRKLLRYVVYHKPTNDNISIWDNREACGNDGWASDDVSSFSTKNSISYPMFRLEPHTRYAFYVQAFTLQSEKINAISDIDYFWTFPGQPQPVKALTISPRSPSSVIVNWEVPKRINGIFSKFVITAKKVPLRSSDRNYCDQPVGAEIKYANEQPETKTPAPPSIEKQTDFECDCIKCHKTCEKKSSDGFEDREAAIDLEDQIQNFVYRKPDNQDEVKQLWGKIKNNNIQQNNVRKTKRQSPEFNPNDVDDDSSKKEIDQDVSYQNELNEYGEYISFTDTIHDIQNNSYLLTNLEHFTWYQITIHVCREIGNETYIDPKTKTPHCSADTSRKYLTPMKPENDIITDVRVTTHTNSSKHSGSLKVTWKNPERPNGAILAYNFQFRKVDGEAAKHSKCITLDKMKAGDPFYIIEDQPSGNYSIQVAITSLAGIGNYTDPVYGDIAETTGLNLLAVIFVLFIIFVLIVALITFYVLKRHNDNISNIKLIANVNPDYAGINYKQDEWEVSRDKVIVLQELGQGSFGMVYEGLLKDLRRKGIEELIPEMRCAVKTVNEQATDKERSSFLQEASVMKQFDTAYVVKLLGVVSISQPTFVVMELMINGDLKGYLRSHRAEYNDDNSSEPLPQPPTIRQMLQMSAEIADGMSYLAAKKFVHRDLAARNCMVGDDLTVKIGDFGMTRDIYETDYYRKGTKGLLPVRWMSPESLKDGVFSTASDVFSYGVVLWEIATLASQPYQGFSNDQVLRYVIEGGVMERPENCPDRLYDLMRKCWQHRPSARPSFLEIIDSLRDVVNDDFKRISYFYSKEGQDLFNQQRQGEFSINMTDDVTTPLTLRQDDDEMTSSIDGNNFLMSEISEERRRKLHDL